MNESANNEPALHLGVQNNLYEVASYETDSFFLIFSNIYNWHKSLNEFAKIFECCYFYIEPVEIEVGYYVWKFKIKEKNVSNWAVQIFKNYQFWRFNFFNITTYDTTRVFRISSRITLILH